jgi:hypothetical protein
MLHCYILAHEDRGMMLARGSCQANVPEHH